MNRLLALTFSTFVICLSLVKPHIAKADELSDYLSACVQKTKNFTVCSIHKNTMLFNECYDVAYNYLSQESATTICNHPIALTKKYIKCVSKIALFAQADLNQAKNYCVSYSEYAESTQCTDKLFQTFSAQETLRSCLSIMNEKVRMQGGKIDLTQINESIRLPMDSVLLIENEIDLPFRGCGSVNVNSKSRQCQVCRSIESRNDITLVHDSVTPRTLMIQSIEMQNQGKELIISVANDPDQISHIRCRSSEGRIPILERKDVVPYLGENGIKLVVPPPIRK